MTNKVIQPPHSLCSLPGGRALIRISLPVPITLRCFNPRARAGRDVQTGLIEVTIFQFQSTRPRGARPEIRRFMGDINLFQSTRPRGARPHDADGFTISWTVSIHAPARGATKVIRKAKIFFSCFNPRARAGRDQVKKVEKGNNVIVSIHAPARGATS